MNSIFRLFYRQIEELIRLSKTSMHAFHLQTNFKDLFNDDQHQPCAFSYDLHPELHLIHIHLHSTCFRLQRAMYRLQASRQIRDEFSRTSTQSIEDEYHEHLRPDLKRIQQLIFKTRTERSMENLSLKTLEELFRQIEENFEIFMEYFSSTSKQNSVVYLGNLISDTLQRFYSIHATLARVILEIERNEKENK